MPAIDLGCMTRREFRERMAAGELKACVLPIAATEQHLEHLAMEHDWRSTLEVARRVAEALAPHVVYTRACAVGVSEHHMRHPGTLTLRPGTFLAVVNDVIRSLKMAGFQHVLVLNGHGGNVAPLSGVWDQFLREHDMNLRFMSYWDVLTDADAVELLQGGAAALPGHAQEFETAIALAAFPENVRRDAMEAQDDPSPLAATAEQGEELLARIVQHIGAALRDMMEGRWVAERPAFFP